MVSLSSVVFLAAEDFHPPVSTGTSVAAEVEVGCCLLKNGRTGRIILVMAVCYVGVCDFEPVLKELT